MTGEEKIKLEHIDWHPGATHALPHLSLGNCEALARSGELLLRVGTYADLLLWVGEFAPQIGFVNTLRQLVTSCMNFSFYSRTREAFTKKDFIDAIAGHFSLESQRLIPIEYFNASKEWNDQGYEQPKTCTVLSLFEIAFLLDNDVRHREEEQLGLSFFDDNNEAIGKFLKALKGSPQTWTIVNHATNNYPSIFLKVHQDICRFCTDKLNEFHKDYLSVFHKLDHLEGVIYGYMDNDLTLSDSLLMSLCPTYNGRGQVPWNLGAMNLLGKSFYIIPNALYYRSLDQKHLFEIAALSGLPRVFEKLATNCRECFIDNLNEISLYAVDGGDNEIIRICAQEGSRFSYGDGREVWKDGSPFSCFRIAYANSKMDVLHWLFKDYPDCAPKYESAADFLISDFNHGPVTTSKIHFLLTFMHKYCSTEVGRKTAARICYYAVRENVFPLVMFLLGTKIVSPNDFAFSYGERTLFFELCNGCDCRGSLFNVNYAKLMIEHGCDPNIRFEKKIREDDEDESETDLFELAHVNGDLEFERYLTGFRGTELKAQS
jgi:hypothetical protein